MKMVVSKDGKRKRKEVPATSSSSQSLQQEKSPDMPKRTKVHAQRKFAQGQGSSTSSTFQLTASSQASATTTSKEPRELPPPTELITHKRPNTEDFLTFLCFRGTAILPPHLDYFNAAGRGVGSSSSSAAVSTTESSTVNIRESHNGQASEQNAVEKLAVPEPSGIVACQESSPIPPVNEKEKESPGFIPFGVRKRAEQVPDRKHHEKLQAIRKKYEEQRLSKLRASKIQKTRSGIKTRSNIEREESDNEVAEATKKIPLIPVVIKETVEEKLVEKKVEVVEEEKKDIVVARSSPQKRKLGLRSGGSAGSDSSLVLDTLIKVAKKQAKKKSTLVKESEGIVNADVPKKVEQAEILKVVEVPEKIIPAKVETVVDTSEIKIKKKPVSKTTPKTRRSTRQTRSLPYDFEGTIVSLSDERYKTPLVEPKIVIATEVKQIEVKVAEQAPVVPVVEPKTVELKKSVTPVLKEKSIPALQTQKHNNESDFSSDDDEPLAMAIGKKSKGPAPIVEITKESVKVTRSRRGFKRDSASPVAALVQITSPAPEINNEPAIVAAVQTSNKPCKKLNDVLTNVDDVLKLVEVAKRNEEPAPQIVQSEVPPAIPIAKPKKKEIQKKLVQSKKQVQKKTNVKSNNDYDRDSSQSDAESVQKTAKITNKKRKRLEKEFEKPAELSQANTTDASEPETRSARPTRKTKEAATIYMNLIGQKLNLKETDNDEDDESIDSFPELPNVRKTTKMENELKASYDKDKKDKKDMEDKKKVEVIVPAPKKKAKTQSDEVKPAVKIVSNVMEFDASSVAVEESSNLKVRKKPKVKEESPLKVEEKQDVPQLEKSFSDSDEEPLAVKFTRNKKPLSITEETSSIKVTTPPKSVELASVTPVKSPKMAIVKTPPAKISPVKAPSAEKTPVKTPPAQTTPVKTPPTKSAPVKSAQAKTTPVKTPPSKITPPKPPVFTPVKSPPPPVKYSPTTLEIPKFVSDKFTPQKPEIRSTPLPKPLPPLALIKQISNINVAPTVPPAPQQLTSPIKLDAPKLKFENPLSPFIRTTNYYPEPKEDAHSTKLNRSLDFTSKLDAVSSPTKLNRSLDIENDIMKKLREVEEMANQKAESSAKINKLTTSSTMRDLMNPLPSLEESGKIFGIASVSLAQSSGPVDTKCTLGKCGSVHKSLGPVVPTEAILGEHMSSKERRRAKVNMTHEQIQKWLVESCVTPDPELKKPFANIDDEYDLKSTPKPINYMTSPSPFKDDEPSTSFKSIKSKQDKMFMGREKASTSSSVVTKGPTLKAKPVLVKESKEVEKPVKPEELPYQEPIKETPLVTIPGRISKLQSTFDTIKPKSADEKPKTVPSKDIKRKEEVVITKKQLQEQRKEEISKTVQQQTAVETLSISPTRGTPSTSAKTENKKSAKSTPAKSTPKPVAQPKSRQSSADRKLIYNQRRTPVYNTKLPDTPKAKKIVNTFGAFSPENETSIYSFDKEDEAIPAATPFRRHSRRESTASRQDDSNEKFSAKKEPIESTPLKKNIQSQPEVSLTLSPEDNAKSASIAVQVSLDEVKTEKVKEENDSDSEGHTFYIPLQGTNLTGNKSDQIIQGVAVKLGTEGPEGPNQRVIMHAKLVTKTQMGSTTTPLPESMGDLVKSLIAGKEAASKSVPIGTVQPRFKSSDSLPETSGTQQQQSTSQLPRVNSNSSIYSQKSKNQRAKVKCDIPVQPHNNTTFPMRDDPAQMVEAPIFRPTEKDFQDPMEYIERISSTGARFGLCKIIPPDSFKPECRLADDLLRFTAYNQYVHKMLNRWGPSTKELCAIRKYLATQSIIMTHPPFIGGMEVDLPRLYHTVQELGGLKDVIEKKKWTRVAEEMCIPKTAHDRVTKLDDIYCKYLLPYDTLSPAERQKLFDEVEADWAKREAKARRNADRSVHLDTLSNEGGESDEDDESEESEGDLMECMVKGRSMPLSAFFRIARNTMSIWFKNSEPDTNEIEAEFWRHVAVRDSHICVHSGSIDSSGWGYGFPTPGPKSKASPIAKHPWNLKVLTNHSGSVLRSLGPVMGVTGPTLQFGMLFSACCWYRDPHGLPWIEYLHTGANKIWYGVPDDQSANLRAALTALVPTHCQNKTIWLPSDTAMVPPHMLTERNVSLCRTEQKPGEYVVVFSRAYTSSVCTGYLASESVYFATNSWLENAKQDFKDIQDSCEPAVFSFEQLLFAISSDTRSNYETLIQILPMVTEMYDKEVESRRKLKAASVTKTERLVTPKNRKTQNEENECDICRANLYISMVKTEDESIYCIQHAIKYVNNQRIQANQCKLVYAYGVDEIEQMLEGLKERIATHQKKQNNKKQVAPKGGKYSNMPTMLKDK